MYPNSDLKAILIDVDGTLYRQSVVRKAMIMRLLRYSAAAPVRGIRSLRIIAAYRRAQEVLRECCNR
jgi:FMN phosphatase YigB (HAD superfamily)